MKATDLFVRCLEEEGITRIYGVPGEENADFMMSLQESSIEFVLTRHEQGAAWHSSDLIRHFKTGISCFVLWSPHPFKFN